MKNAVNWFEIPAKDFKRAVKVLMPKTQVTSEIGYYAQFMDTEGNKVALHSMK